MGKIEPRTVAVYDADSDILTAARLTFSGPGEGMALTIELDRIRGQLLRRGVGAGNDGEDSKTPA